MIHRCHNPRAHNFRYYGARGISVCREWRDSFEAFLSHIGLRPADKHSLDRIDNDGNYEPGNVRWATVTEQNRNNRQTHFIEAFGENLAITEWAERAGTTQQVISWRIANGWTPREAVSKDPHRAGRSYDDLRREPGSGHPNAKMTEGKVRKARAQRAAGASVKQLAENYGISQGTMSTLLSGKAWKHVK